MNPALYVKPVVLDFGQSQNTGDRVSSTWLQREQIGESTGFLKEQKAASGK